MHTHSINAVVSDQHAPVLQPQSTLPAWLTEAAPNLLAVERAITMRGPVPPDEYWSRWDRLRDRILETCGTDAMAAEEAVLRLYCVFEDCRGGRA